MTAPPNDWFKFSFDAVVGEEFAIAALVVRDFRGKLIFWKLEKVPSSDPM